MPSACMPVPLDIETVSSDPVQGCEGTIEFLIQRLGDTGTVALDEAISWSTPLAVDVDGIAACSFQATFLRRGAGLAPRDRNDDGGVWWLTRLCRRAALTICLCLMPWRRFFPRSPR